MSVQGSQHQQVYPARWYRSSLFSAFLVGITAFLGPGIFGALNGMGAGGGTKPGISNAANAIVFGTMVVASILVGGIVNRITPKYALLLGTLGYVPYAAGLYVSDRYDKTWLLLFGAVVMAISASFLWVASASILLGYPEEDRKGKAASFKFGMQSLGGSIGGMISLALNVHTAHRGGVTQATYIVMMVLMCLSWPAALLLPSADRVQRRDGRPVVLHKQPTFWKELEQFRTVIFNPAVLALVPFMIYSQWFLSYQWGFNFAYFTVRTRALNSMLFYLMSLTGSLSLGALLDWTKFSRPVRAKIGFFVVLILAGASWVVGLAVQVKFKRDKPTYDFGHSSSGLGIFTFLLWGLSDNMVVTYKYWLVGTLTNDINQSSFLSAIINSMGSIGSTMGFVISSQKFNYDGSCAINLAIFFLSMPGVAWVAFSKVRETTHGGFAGGVASGSDLKEKSHDDISEDQVVVQGKV